MCKKFSVAVFVMFFLAVTQFVSAQPIQGVQSKDEAITTGEKVELPYQTIYLESGEAILFDNGPLVSLPAGGCSGGDASILDGTVGGHTLFGWNCNSAAAPGTNFYMADDFTSTTVWNLDSMKFFAYQTGATVSTVTGVYVQIWSGSPLSGGTVVWGDLTTNRLQRTGFSNIYRAQSTTPTDCNRRVQEVVATTVGTLPAGQYWVQWGITGSLASGPWCPPVTIAGIAVTGDALQKTATGWVAALNGLTSPNGAPFIVYGSNVNPNTFFDNFDSYTAGLLVACQNPIAWTTWSNAPCGAEDAEVSNAFAYSGANSAKIVTNDDFVKPLGNKTTGKWYMSFLYYIPATKSGYFNTMNVFTPPSTFTWGMDVYFDAGGAGRIDTTGGGAVNPAFVKTFTWAVAQWNQAIVIVDLNTQLAEFWTGTNPLNLTQVATWNWTQGGTKPNSLAVNDFFGATANDSWYMDDYFFSDEMPVVVPVELTSFTATTTNTNVTLNWSTATELNNSGFQIERSSGNEYQVVGFVAGHGTTTEVRNYSYSDQNVNAGSYTYRLKQIDFDGTFEYSNAIEVEVVGVKEFTLGQNYPNPFNPATTINFSLAEPSFVKLAIFNLLGEEVQVLKNEYMNAGSFNVSFNASSLPSGMYLYKIETAQYSSVRKMMLMK